MAARQVLAADGDTWAVEWCIHRLKWRAINHGCFWDRAEAERAAVLMKADHPSHEFRVVLYRRVVAKKARPRRA
jgi:hypothetical protein